MILALSCLNNDERDLRALPTTLLLPANHTLTKRGCKSDSSGAGGGELGGDRAPPLSRGPDEPGALLPSHSEAGKKESMQFFLDFLSDIC